MRAVQRLKGLGWLLSCVVVVLGCYMISLSVANERNKLARVDAKILQAQRDLRALGTEFDTRANLVQLERWNGDVLALTAPTAGQYLSGERQFAAMVPGGAPQVQLAALVVPAGVTPIQAANAAAVAAVAATPPAPAPVAKLAVAVEAPVAVPAPAVKTVAAVRKAEAVAMLDRKLLSDTTLGDIMRGARAEAVRSR